MMSQEANDLITRTGPKDPCGKLMRMYWQPAALVDELQGPRPVRPVKLLGENLVLFRDEQGRYGLIDRHCAHRGADLAFGRLEHGASSSAPILSSRRPASSGPISAKVSRRPFRRSMRSSHPTATPLPSRAIGAATGCRPWKSASTPRTPPSCIASSRTRTRRTPMASSSAALPPAPTCR
jgi:hypothetical protein